MQKKIKVKLKKIRDPFAQHAKAKIAAVFKHKNDKRKKDKERREFEELIKDED